MIKKTVQIHAPMNPYTEHLRPYANPLPAPSIAVDPSIEDVQVEFVDNELPPPDDDTAS